ncbi:MAG: ArsR family transcriptional regulator [Candidatus Cryosericum sp.]
MSNGTESDRQFSHQGDRLGASARLWNPADLTAKLHIGCSTVQRQLRSLMEAGLVRAVHIG